MKRFCATLAFLWFSFILPRTQVLLKHETLSAPDRTSMIGASFTKGYYILQFDEIPSEADRYNLNSLGCELMGYLPKNAFIGYLNIQTDFSSLERSKVAGVHPFKTYWKFNPDFLQSVPPHAVDQNGNIGFWIHPFPHADTPNWEDSLTKLGIQYFSKIPYINAWEIRVPQGLFNLSNIPSWIQYLDYIPAPGDPENLQATANHRVARMLNTNHNPTPLTGAGVRLLLNDDGRVSPHIDFHNRMTNLVTTNNGSHGDHCAGIIAGAGNLEQEARGNAPGAGLFVSLYTHSSSSNLGFFSYPNAYLQDSLLVSSNSFGNGCNTGYNSLALYLDQTVRTHKGLSHVFSAGNSGTSNCSYGAGSGWGNITGGTKVGKNVLAVGNLTKANALSSSSSRGPADDGRVKPNLCAVGSSVYSTYENASQYAFASGTSMACPAVTGVMGLLHQGYQNLNGGEIAPSELLHALLMNTADDLGNPGPDFRFGYGRVNAKAAWEAMDANWYLNDTIVHNASASYSLVVPSGLSRIRVMLYWHDEPAQVQAARALVNDLDLALITPTGDTIRPWVLNPLPIADSLNANARRGRDSLNNMEQVTWTNPAPGNYTILVNGFSVPIGPQSFFLSWFFESAKLEWAYPSGGEAFIPGTSERLYWDYLGASGTFAIHYSLNGGQSWTAINTSVNSGSRDLLFNVPNNLQAELATFRIVRGAFSDTTLVPVSIIQVPQNLRTDTVCPYSVQLVWDAVPGADAYDVFMLGNLYMDSIATTTQTQFTVAPVPSTGDLWFAVRARTNQGVVGRRCRAISVQPGSGPCDPVYDLAIAAPIFPFAPETPACFSSLPIKIKLRNRSYVDFSGFSLHVSVNNGAPVTIPFQGVLPWLHDTVLNLPVMLPQTTAQSVHLKIWHDAPSDNVPLNDTLEYSFVWSNSTTATLPWKNDFESMNSCLTTDCNAIVCNPGQGFVNVRNVENEQSDWTIIQAPGPIAQPFTDFDPGMPGGQLAQLAASACSNEWAHLHSPCIDLSGATRPYLRFGWYIPPGNTDAKIHVDVFSQGEWFEDVLIPLQTPMQNWQIAKVSLEPFIGQTIMLRFRAFSGAGSQGGPSVDGVEIKGISASFLAPDTLCLSVNGGLTDLSIGFIDSVYWDFGANSQPPFSNSTGNQVVAFNQAGVLPVSLTVYGHDTVVHTSQSVFVEELSQQQIQISVIQAQTATYQLTAVPGGNGTFTWNFSNGTSQTGNPVVQSVDSLTGQLLVTLLHSNFCGTDSAFTMLSPASLNTLFASIQLYPNPSLSGNSALLSWPEMLGVPKIRILDAVGRQIQFLSPEENDVFQLPSNLPAGIYFVHIQWTVGSVSLPWSITVH
jgi:hypothetical protein